jgi:hypothetical protein
MPRPPHNRWVQGNSAGPYTSPLDKFLIHTTEGGSIDGAISAYRANNSWPHLTVDARVGRAPTITGHLDLDVAARSLRNMAGGVQTNTDGVIQIEVVGNAANPAGIDWAWIGEHVVGPICQTMGIPVHSTVRWVPYPQSYGLNASQRLSGAAWTAFQGVLGHQHAPENDHGDPGAIPILVVLDAAKQAGGPVPKPPEEDDEMIPVYGVQNDATAYYMAPRDGYVQIFHPWDPRTSDPAWAQVVWQPTALYEACKGKTYKPVEFVDRGTYDAIAGLAKATVYAPG